MSTKVQYFTQARSLLKGDVLIDWRDGCQGHDDFYAALNCLERHFLVTSGKADNLDLDVEELLIAVYFEMQLSQGITYELRLIKRTTTDEVQDA